MATLNTLTTIRRRVGELTGDMHLCTATANGTNADFTDALNLHHENKIFQGRQGIFSGGTTLNLGRVIRVTSLDRNTQKIEFTPALPTNTGIGDELELWNQRDEGVTPPFVTRSINNAIRDVTENAKTPVTSDAFTFAYGSNVISVDTLLVDAVVDGTNWKGITGVDWKDDIDDWHPIPRADFRVDSAARTVEILNRPRILADGHSVRIRGAYLDDPLTAESDTTSVDFEWITNAVAAVVIAKRMETSYDRKPLEGRYLQFTQRADQRLAKTPRRRRGTFWRLD